VAGFIAIFADDRRTPVDESELGDLAATFAALRSTSVQQRVSSGPHGHVVTLTRGADIGAESTVLTDGDSWTVTVGVAHALTDAKAPPPNGFEGQFGIVHHDAAADETTIATDPFGLLAVYVARRDGRTYASTSALALAKHLALTPSRPSVEIFLRAGSHFGATTNWEGLERLEPGSSLVLGRDGVRRNVYWRPEIEADVGRMSFEETVRLSIDVARSTYSALLAGDKGWADLTGGFDTRLMLLLLQTGNVRFRTNTSGEPDDLEVRLARKVASTAGWEWVRIAPPDPWGDAVAELLPLSVAWCDGQLNAFDVAGTLWGHREKSRVDRTLFVGAAGEHFRNAAWSQELFAAGRSTSVKIDNLVDMRLLQPLDTTVLARDPTPEVRADLGRRMLAWASPYSSELNTTQLDVMYIYRMTGHFGSYLSAAGAFLRTQMPLYFRPVLTTAISSNHRYRANHRLMRHIIASLDPRVAAVQTTTPGPAEPFRVSNLHRFVPYYLHIARRVVTKLSYTTTGHALLSTSTPLSPLITTGRRRLVEVLVRDGVFDANRMRTRVLYKPGELTRLVENVRSGDFSRFVLLGRIATLELALRAADADLAER